MEAEALKRQIQRMWPELAAKTHLPIWGQVISIEEAPALGAICDPFRPYYTANIQILDENGNPDTKTALFEGVPLPNQGAGAEAGNMGWPEEGSVVEIAFAFNRSDKPFIRQVLPYQWALPEIKQGEQLQQQRAEVFKKTDQHGNHITQTDESIINTSYQRKITAGQNQEAFQTSFTSVQEHSTEEIGGAKIVEALGLLRMNSAGDLDLGALENLHLTAGSEIIETIGKLKRSVAAELQHIEVTKGKVWLGSSAVNIIRLLLELMGVVEAIAATAASHTHPGIALGKDSTKPPNQAGDFSGQSSLAQGLKNTLNPITK